MKLTIVLKKTVVNKERKERIHMTYTKWFDNEFKMIAAFSCEVAPLIASVEAHNEKIKCLVEEKGNIQEEIGEAFVSESRRAILDHTIQSLEKTNEGNLRKLKEIKEAYMAEGLIDTLETLTSIDEGEKLSDDACELLKTINNLSLNYQKGQK